MKRLRAYYHLLVVAYWRFLAHDGWAIASHIALSILMALFPFLILLTSLASFFGSQSLADEAGDIILEFWPEEIGQPLAGEVHRILTEQRRDILTIGAGLALYFASSGVESLRVGLNRAYGMRESRSWWVTRLESIAFVIGGVFVMLGFAILLVFAPLILRALADAVPWLSRFGWTLAFLRVGAASTLIVAALVLAHKFVPAGRRPWRTIVPGILITLLLWIVGGLTFGWYLEEFPGSYASTYGGLATAMIALVFLYTLAAIFLYGGELNGIVTAARRKRQLKALRRADQTNEPRAFEPTP